MIRAKGAHRRRKPPRFALGPSAGWRVLSVLAMGLFGAILLAPGAAVAKTAPVKASLNVVVIGDLYSYGAATSSNAELRHAAPPTLQALNQIQAANKSVRLNVLFIPVTEASPALLSQPSGSGTSKRQALIKAVSGASVVIVGVGAGNASLAASMRSVLFGSSAPQSTFNQLMSSIDSGTYLQNQTALLNEVAANAAPGVSIISVGYPGMQPEQLGSGLHFFSPYTLTTVSQQQANASAQLVSALNTADNEATSIVAAQNHGLHFLFANLAAVAQSTGSSSKAHTRSKAGVVSSQSQPSDLNLLGSAMVPYVDQAVNDQLAAKGVMGAQSIPVLTPTAPWNLQVLVPLSPQSQPSSSSSSNSGVNAPPAPVAPPNQPNPEPAFVLPPQVGPSSGGSGSGGSGGHHPGDGGSSGGVGISIGSGSGSGGNGSGSGSGRNGGGSTGTGSSGLSNPPQGSGQTNPGSQPTGGQSNQGSGSDHPATQPANSQSTPASPPGSSQPSPSPGRPGPCGNSTEPNATVTCSPANAMPTPSAGSSPVEPVTLPMQCAPTAQSASSPCCGGVTCGSNPSTQPNTPSSNPSTEPASSSTPTCSASELFGMSQSGCGTQPGQSQGSTGPLTPTVPAPPAPLPKPIAPQQTPGTPTGNTGTSTPASSPAASSSPATSQSSTAPPTTTAATSPSSQPGDSSAPATATEGGPATTTALGNTATGSSTTATGGNIAATSGSTANGSGTTATGGSAATRGNAATGGSNTTTTGGSTASAGGSTASGGGGGSGGGAPSGS